MQYFQRVTLHPSENIIASDLGEIVLDLRCKTNNDFVSLSVSKKKSAIVIARSSSLLSLCKNFNLALYPKSIKIINIKLGIRAHHDKMQLQDKGHNSEAIALELFPFLT